MKKILENFVTKRYKEVSQKPFSATSFRTGIIGYAALLSFVLISLWAGGAGEVSNNYLRTLIFPLICMITIIVISWGLFQFQRLKKYAAIISYFSGFFFLLFVEAFSACLSEEPIKYALYGSIIIFVGWVVGVITHIVLVSISLKKKSMNIRDEFGDYYVNIVSVIALLNLIYFSISDKEMFLLIGTALISAALLVGLTFSFPRVLFYWRKEQPKKDISVYGDSIKLMKRGKSK